MKDIDAISGDVLDVALRLHRELGPGLLESVYETVLAARLNRMGYRIARQRAIDIEFEGLRFEAAFRIDLLVDEQVDRAASPRACEATLNIPEIDQAARRAAYQLR